MQREKILLHACCAPCAAVPVRRLSEIYDVTLYFYNPNIHPEKEYTFRKQEIIALCQRWHLDIETGPYDMEAWFDRIRGFEHEPERGARCEICIRMRLEKTAKLARKRGYDGFTSTLSLSPLKSIRMIQKLGEEIAKQTGVKFLCDDFKKKDGFKQSVKISKTEGLYRQDYCGCIYSRKLKSE